MSRVRPGVILIWILLQENNLAWEKVISHLVKLHLFLKGE
jgi:hypothetical protein